MASIIVCFPKPENAREIRNLLVRNGFQVHAVCVTGAQAINAADDLNGGVIITGYKLKDMIYTELKESVSSEFELLVVASESALFEYAIEDVMTLSLPLKLHDLVNTVDLMCQNADRRRRKRKATPRVRSEAEEKLLTEAKQLLMERNNMTEEEAHRYLQKCSMESGTNLVETAEMVLTLIRSG